MQRSNVSVPVFKLYGEQHDWPTPDLLHLESIPERSSLHDWHIRPHRHGDLLQVLYMQSGRVELEIEGGMVQLEGTVLQVVPALCVHGYRFSPDTRGYVLSLALPLVSQLEQALGEHMLRKALGLSVVGKDKGYLNWLFANLWHEYVGQQNGRDIVLASMINGLLIWVHRRGRQHDAPSFAKGQQHLQRFTALVEEHYREHLSVEQYAHRLGCSAPHLNALCRRLAGHSALELINRRLLLEAKRCLVYTSLNISQISESLGFSEPAYFSRFFKRHSAVTPSAFRHAPRHEDAE